MVPEIKAIQNASLMFMFSDTHTNLADTTQSRTIGTVVRTRSVFVAQIA